MLETVTFTVTALVYRDDNEQIGSVAGLPAFADLDALGAFIGARLTNAALRKQRGSTKENLGYPYVVSMASKEIIPLIKEVRAVTGLGLHEAKQACDALRDSAKPIRLSNIRLERKSDLFKKLVRDFTAVGATIELRAE